MTTVTEREPQINQLKPLDRPAPGQTLVEMIEDDGQGIAWLSLAGEWFKIVSVKNLWDIDGHYADEKPLIRMHFLVMVENGSQILLFQDLIDGSWYREITLRSGGKIQPTSIS
tara:strand:+ start:135 stop:473 length:339 start_codon:yes stop_codon:yes gene_type:complete